MKVLRSLNFSRLGFVGTIILGTLVAWCVLMPNEVSAENAVAIFGGEDDCMCAETSSCPGTYGGETCDSGTYIMQCDIDTDTERTHNCENDTSNKPCGSQCGELTGGTYTNSCGNFKVGSCPDDC